MLMDPPAVQRSPFSGMMMPLWETAVEELLSQTFIANAIKAPTLIPHFRIRLLLPLLNFEQGDVFNIRITGPRQNGTSPEPAGGLLQFGDAGDAGDAGDSRGRSCKSILRSPVWPRLGQLRVPPRRLHQSGYGARLHRPHRCGDRRHGLSQLDPGELRRTCGPGDGQHQDGKGTVTRTDPFTIVVGFTFDGKLTHNTYFYPKLPPGSSGTTSSISSPDAMTGMSSTSRTTKISRVSRFPPGGKFSIDSG